MADHDVTPLFHAPPGSCDAHFHIFGPADRYPHGGVNEKLRYTPPLAPLEDYLAHARPLGFERFVFVQPSAYGRDNACMVDALRALPGHRGIVDVDENAPDAMLAEFDAAGVRGVRVNVSPVKPSEPGFSKTMLPRIERLDARCSELGYARFNAALGESQTFVGDWMDAGAMARWLVELPQSANSGDIYARAE